jgi:predicted membrane protein
MRGPIRGNLLNPVNIGKSPLITGSILPVLIIFGAMKLIVIAILIYFGFIFIFRFVIPLYMASRKMKQGFREMHERMQQQMQQHQEPPPQPQQKQKPEASKGDYIEFEEIK